MEIIPAIMPDSYDDLCAKASRVHSLVPLAQIDIMDGIFVRSKSWPYTEGGVKAEPHFVALAKQDEGMPYWEEMDYELDLMITEPEKHIDEWLPLGASRLIFHIESIKDSELFWSHDIFKDGARDISGDKVIEIALAINPDTPLGGLEAYVGRIDFVQMMGIARIGYQGEPFDERVLERVNAFHMRHPNIPIAIDGGVSMKTVHDLRAAGATRLVAGSAIFGADDARAALRDLKTAL